MIEAIQLTKDYGRLRAIESVSFRVEPGEILGFLGPNGSGKTTTLKILTGILTPTAGRARIAGYDVLEHPLEVRRRIGYLPENVPLYKDMKVYDYLNFVAEVKGLVEKGPRRYQVATVMERCGLLDRGDQLIGRLSKGYRQRVGLAQALLGDPPVLILDEPTEGLDPAQIIEIRQLIRELGRDRTVILSTHILPEVSMIADRVVILFRGRVVASGTPEELTQQVQGGEILEIRVEAPLEALRQALEGISGIQVEKVETTEEAGTVRAVVRAGNEDRRKEIARVIHQKGWGLLEMRSRVTTLEEVFVHLVTREEQHTQ